MDVGLAWLFLLSLIGVIFVIVLPDRMMLKSSEHRIERLEEKLWDLQSDVRSIRADVSTLERGQARLDDRVPEMSSALRNLKVDLASVKRWS
ncbi:MAG: hypothetical protein F4Y50_06435 [Dehalococcoidia bacterium]|nr:hypothetical protein [Dehalococcoidia bacterium]